MQIKPGMEARFEAMSRDLYARSHANEPGLLRYEYWRGQTPQMYYALLSFVDYESFLIHQASDHHSELTAGIKDMVDSLRLEFVDPVPGAAPLPTNTSVALTQPTAPLIEYYADRYPYLEASWWPKLR